MKRRSLALRHAVAISLSCIAVAAHATRPFQATITCPVGGEVFTANLIGSDYVLGRDLDLRPIGGLSGPWPMAQCRSNGLVMYKTKFSEREIERLQELVPSAEYQALRSEHTPYYLAAWLQGHLNEPPAQIAWTLLEATWEAKPHQYANYALATLEQYKLVLARPAVNAKARLQHELIAGELERRLARYDDALARFAKLKQELPPEAPEKAVVELQLKLISERDTGRHAMPSAKRPGSTPPP